LHRDFQGLLPNLCHLEKHNRPGLRVTEPGNCHNKSKFSEFWAFFARHAVLKWYFTQLEKFLMLKMSRDVENLETINEVLQNFRPTMGSQDFSSSSVLPSEFTYNFFSILAI